MGTRAHFYDFHVSAKGRNLEPIDGALIYIRNEHADPDTLDDLISVDIFRYDSDDPDHDPDETLSNPYRNRAKLSHSLPTLRQEMSKRYCGGNKRHSACTDPGCPCDCHDPIHKTCSRCEEKKLRSEFTKNAKSWDCLQGFCRECRRKIDAAYRAKLPFGHHRARMLEREYGITQADYDRILAEQGGGCALCGATTVRHENLKKPRGEVSLHVDHDHKTGKVRGILCGPCNHALGKLNDDPELLRKAADYIERGGLLGD